MKKYLLLILAITLTLTFTLSGATFLWNPNSESDIAGYRLYYSAGTNNFSQIATITGRLTTNYVLTNLPAGTNRYYLTAFNSNQIESLPSGTISANVPSIPTNFQLIITVNGTNITILQVP